MAQDHTRLLGTTFDKVTRTVFTDVLAELVRSSKDEELSLAQVATVHLLAEHGSMRVLEVAEVLQLSPSAASRMIDVLAGRGLLSRDEDPADRRARVLGLTRSGRELAERMNEDRLRVFARHIPRVPFAISDKVLATVLRIRGKPKLPLTKR